MKSTKLNDRNGYMLFESLIALAMVSLSLYVLIPHSVQFFADLKTAEAQVACWRVAQEQMRIIAKGGSPIDGQASSGIRFSTNWNPEIRLLEVIGNDGAERVTVRAEEIQAEGP